MNSQLLGIHIHCQLLAMQLHISFGFLGAIHKRMIYLLRYYILFVVHSLLLSKALRRSMGGVKASYDFGIDLYLECLQFIHSRL